MIRYLSLKPEVPADDYWDMSLLKDILTDTDRDIIVIPGARQGDIVDDLSMEIAQYSNPTVLITSDEEHQFPIEQLYHPNMKLYVMMPDPQRHKNVDGYLPLGYTPHTRELVKKNGMGAKSLNWFFAGQVTPQRQACIDQLQDLSGGKLEISPGFAQGLPYEEYMQYMCRAKVVPCPIGNVSPDCFRVYEALEAGCIPIVQHKEFWTLLFGDVPFPVVEDWNTLPDLINHYKDRPDVNNKCQAWWLLKKRELQWTLLH